MRLLLNFFNFYNDTNLIRRPQGIHWRVEQQEESDGKESMGGQGSHPEADFGGCLRKRREGERGRKVGGEEVGGLGEARGRPLSPARRYDEGRIFSPEKEETIQ